MIIHYLKIAFRNLWKYKYQNLIGILGLSVGLCIFCICLFMVLYGYEYNGNIPDARNIHSIVVTVDVSEYEIRSTFPEIEEIIPAEKQNCLEMVTVHAERKVKYATQLLKVEPEYLDFFSLELLYGNRQSAQATANSILLFESTAKQFGSPADLIGRTIETDNNTYIITGILKDIKGLHMFAGNHGFVVNPQIQISDYGHMSYYIRTKDFGTLEKKIKAFNERHDNLSPTKSISISPFYTNYMDDPDGSIVKSIILGVGLLILLAALFNFISFHTSLFLNRLKECAIRKVNGARRRHIFWLFYTEIMIGMLLAALFAFFFLPVVISSVNEIVGMSDFIDPNITSRLMANCLLVGLAGGALLSLFPVGFINRNSIQSIIFGLSAKGGNFRPRAALIAFEMVILYIFTLAVACSLKRAADITPKEFSDYKAYHYTLQVKEIGKSLFGQGFQQELLNEILSLPEVSKGFMIHQLYGSEDLRLEHDSVYTAKKLEVTEGVFDFFGIKTLEGEVFSNSSSSSDYLPVVVNRKMAETMALDKASVVGQVFTESSGRACRIIGIIENNPFMILSAGMGMAGYKDRRLYYAPFSGDKAKDSYYIIYTDLNKNLFKQGKEKIKHLVERYVPEENLVSYSVMSEEIKKIKNNFSLIPLFAPLFAVSLIICLLSIYSAIYMNTEKRRKEVAIRKINGAVLPDIIRLFARQYFMMWAIVSTVGLIVSIPLVKYLLPEFSYTSIVLIGIAIYILIALLILFTIVFKIVHVARLNVAQVIKSE